MADSSYYLVGVKNDRVVVFRCNDDWLERLTDLLFDKGFKLSSIEKQSYKTYLHGPKLIGVDIYHLDNDVLTFTL